MKRNLSLFFTLLGGAALSAGLVLADDWPQWGGSQDRNMVSSAKNIPGKDITPGEFKPGTEEVNMSTAENVRWVAKLGSQTYGTPTIADGRVFVGTNNEAPRDPNHVGDRGIVMCFDEKTGEFLWQLVIPKLGAGKVSDWEFLGVCSSPTIVGDRGYVVTNRCEIVCFDVEGQKNGNQGMQDEGKYMVDAGEEPASVGEKDADIIWTYDMRGELGVFPHNVASSSVLVVGDKVIATTSNGVDWSHLNIPSPTAPSLIMLDAKTGELMAEDVSGISARVLHCSWASPMLANVEGKEMIIFGAGDGWCYGYDTEPVEEEEEGEKFGVFKELFRYDANPPEYRKVKYPKPLGPNEVVATPVFYEGKLYVLTGQDPEHGEGVGMLSCIDPSKRGDISGQAEWTFKGIERSMSTPAILDGLLYTADYRGFAYCIDAKTGEKYWEYDTFGHIWGSPLVVDGKVYIGTEEGELIILETGKELKVIRGETDEYEEYDISLKSVAATDDLPDTGKSLIIVALVGDDLHIRIFDDAGKRVVDKAEAELVRERDVTAIKMLMNEIQFPHESILPDRTRQEIVKKVPAVSDLLAVEFKGPIYSSPVVANGALYITTQSHLYSLSKDAKGGPVTVSATE